MDVQQATVVRPVRQTSSHAAWVLLSVALLLTVCAAALGLRNHTGMAELVFLLPVVCSAGVGGVIASHQPANPIGFFFLASALSFTTTMLAGEYATYGLVTNPGSVPAAEAAVWLSAWLWVPGAVLVLVVVPLHFPNGRLVSPRWRPVVWLAFVLTVIMTGSSALEPGPVPGSELANPWGMQLPGPFAAVLGVLVLPVWIGLVFVAAVSLVVRFRRSGQKERQQIKWLTYAAALVPTWFLLNSPVERATPTLFPVIDAVALSAVPIAAGVAIVKHQLYDIDPVINRTLVYGALTVCVVGIYVLVVGYLGQLFRTSDGNLVVSLIATGIVAVVFAPLRDRLQRAVNRWMYGDRDDPYTVVSRLGRRLEATLAPEAVLPTIVETVKEALKLPYAAISLPLNGAHEIVASAGEPVEKPQRLSLAHQNVPIGELLLGTRSGEGAFSPADRRLLEDLARHAGLAAHSVRLTADLQHARERLVSAREEERRRLRRDLHDGLGPMLGSLTLKLDVARDLLEQDAAAADTLLVGLKEQAQAAVADIRRLVYALRPPALDDLGLVGAVHETAMPHGLSRLYVSVQAPESLPDLPAAVEVAAYRIVQEAVTNVARHAEASRCTIRLALRSGVLEVEIEDDGRGLPAATRSGIGMTAMRERATELGGQCIIERSPMGGTRVCASLPCAGFTSGNNEPSAVLGR